MASLEIVEPGGLCGARYDADAPARLHVFDSLRGLAALAVVACHYLILLSAAPAPLSPVHPGPFAALMAVPPFSMLLTAYGPVILFFVLSGHVLALSLTKEKRPGWTGFAVRRICRIWLPYAAVLLVSFAIGSVVLAAAPDLLPLWRINTWHADATSLGSAFQQLLMASPNVELDLPAWTLLIEMKISLVFPLLFVLVRRAPACTLAAALLVAIAARDAPAWLAPAVPDAAAYVIYFAAGAWLALNRDRVGAVMRIAAPPALPLLAVVALLLLSVPGGRAAAPLCTGLGAVLAVALATAPPAAASLQTAPRIGRNLWRALGRVSYSLYLTHFVVMMAFGALFGTLLSMPAILALAAPAIALTACAGYRYLELPAIRLGRVLADRLAA